MAFKKALSEGEVQSANFKSVRAWIKANASTVKAKNNKTVLYSGEFIAFMAPLPGKSMQTCVTSIQPGSETR